MSKDNQNPMMKSTVTRKRDKTVTNTNTNTNANPSSKSLQSYLSSQKQSIHKGPPPTSTTMMLQSILDKPKNENHVGRSNNKLKSSNRKLANKRTVHISTSSKNIICKNSKNSNQINTNGNTSAKGLWSNIMSINSNINNSKLDYDTTTTSSTKNKTTSTSHNKMGTKMLHSRFSNNTTIDDLLSTRNNNSNDYGGGKGRKESLTGSNSIKNELSISQPIASVDCHRSILSNPLVHIHKDTHNYYDQENDKKDCYQSSNIKNMPKKLSTCNHDTSPNSKRCNSTIETSNTTTNSVTKELQPNIISKPLLQRDSILLSSKSFQNKKRKQLDNHKFGTQSFKTTTTTNNNNATMSLLNHNTNTITVDHNNIIINRMNDTFQSQSNEIDYTCQDDKLTIIADKNRNSTASPDDTHRNLPDSLPPIFQLENRPSPNQQSIDLKFSDPIISSNHDSNNTTKQDTVSLLENPQVSKHRNNDSISRTKSSKRNINDNFVKLNLKNRLGSCRGVGNTSKSRKKMKKSSNTSTESIMNNQESQYNNRDDDDYIDNTNINFNNDDSNKDIDSQSQKVGSSSSSSKLSSVHSVIDAIDDYLDGTYSPTTSNQNPNDSKRKRIQHNHSLGNHDDDNDAIFGCKNESPLCPRHSLPCKLLTVKKNTGNKGRKFYVCSMPQGEQCDFFQWEDDCIESVRKSLKEMSSKSGFITRQVAMYIDRFKQLTLPELRIYAKKQGLNITGKKSSLLARLSVWIRDEIYQGCKTNQEQDDDDNHDDDDQSSMEYANVNTSSKKQRLDLSESNNTTTSGIDSEADEDLSSDYDENESSSSEDDEELEIYTENEYTVGHKRLQSNIPNNSLLHSSLLDLFGFDDFREGQEWAIQRCISHKNSLLVAPTGMGKSICYTLSAALMDGICLVVSPLVSLMEDQLRQMPPRIPAATLSGNLSAKRTAVIIDDLIHKRFKVLFVSPERLTSASFRRLLNKQYNSSTGKYERILPEVSLLCVDEAHCLSQWGHNFRPAYLRLRSLLGKIAPLSVLALTATAGPLVVRDICEMLNIPNGTVAQLDMKNDDVSCSSRNLTEDLGVMILNCNRDNIQVTVKFVEDESDKLDALVKILKLPVTLSGEQNFNHNPMGTNVLHTSLHGCLSSGSVIIYVWRQKDVTLVTEQLRSMDIPGGVVSYHGGMDTHARSKAQSLFLRGKARVCVATVAFGLGINKVDIRGVIHLCLPPSLEHYLQEIGRAGRDGKNSLAISLVPSNELALKQSMAHSDRITKIQIKLLLTTIQKYLREALQDRSKINEDQTLEHLKIALPLNAIVRSIDCKEETILTVLSLLEKNFYDFPSLLDIENINPDLVTVIFKKRKVDELAKTEPVVRCIQRCDGKIVSTNVGQHIHTREESIAAYSFGVIQFSVMQCVRLLGSSAEPRHVYATLRRLQNSGELELSFDTAKGRSIHVNVNTIGMHTFQITPSDGGNAFDRLIDMITHHFEKQERVQVEKVNDIHSILLEVGSCSMDDEVQAETKADVKVPHTSSSTAPDYDQYQRLASKRQMIFQRLVNQYFEGETNECDSTNMRPTLEQMKIPRMNQNEKSFHSLITDVETMLCTKSIFHITNSIDNNINIEDSADVFDYISLSISKFLHGLDSPCTPALKWFRHPLWGKWKPYEFMSMLECVESIVSESKMKGQPMKDG